MSPATSEAQKRLTCMALAIKLGKAEASISSQAARMSREMSIKDLSEFCKSPVQK